MPAPSLLQSAVRTALLAMADPDRAAAQQRYMKSAMPFAGVRMPDVRRLARRLGREHPFADRAAFEAGLRQQWDQAVLREERYAVLEISGLRAYRVWQDPMLVPMYEHFVVTGAWWDLVDDVAIHRVAPIRATHPDDVNPVVRRWADDERLWLRRTAVLSQVGSRDAWDPRLLADVLEPNLGRPEPFLRKAVGWALRDASARHPAWVRQYVDDHQDRMSPLARKEALRGLAGPRGPARPT